MITVNEIRLGNWFKDYENKYFEWELRHFELMTLSIDADEIISEPIPLTEDILLKCGFGRCTTKEWLSLNLCNDWTFIYANCDKATFELSISHHSVMLNINYLHQLQNLIFALTQQELNIQL